MRQIEQDLDTALDWLVVDHFNTGQPHTHIVARGVTDQGKILYIAGDYIAHGIRARASDLVTRQLGRQTELEVQQKLGREVDHDRFTRLDRTLLAEPEDGRVDLRISPGQSYLVRANRHLLIARLRKLEAMELADPVEPGVWELSPRLEWALKHLGQRIDTIGIMQRALGEEAAERSVSHFTIHRELPRSPVTGHLRGKGLAGDGLADKVHLVIDGVDGRVHYVELDAVLVSDDARIGAILTVGKEPSARSVQRVNSSSAETGVRFPNMSKTVAVTDCGTPAVRRSVSGERSAWSGGAGATKTRRRGEDSMPDTVSRAAKKKSPDRRAVRGPLQYPNESDSVSSTRSGSASTGPSESA